MIGCAGPWRTSGNWWEMTPESVEHGGKAAFHSRGRESTLEPEAQRSRMGERGWGPARSRGGRESTVEPECVSHGAGAPCELEKEGGSTRYAERNGAKASGVGVGPHAIRKKSWNRDEWDVALSDGTVYRLFRDCSTDAWFIDAIVD